MVPMLMGAAVKMLKSSESKKEVNKKITASKFVSKSSDKEKKSSSIVKAATSSIVAKPSAKLIPRISLPPVKETKTPQGKVSFDYLSKILDALVKNTSSLLKNSKSEYDSSSKGADLDRRTEQLEKKREREEKVETSSRVGGEKKRLKIEVPKMPGVFEFLKRFAVGTAVMQILSIFSDPKNKNSIVGFLANNMEAVILGMVSIIGALLLAPLTPILGAFGILFNITAALVGSLVSLILNPIVLPVVATAIATAGVIAATQTPAGQNSQISGPNAVWRDKRLNSRSRKAIIESTFEHMPYNTWPQDAKDLYEKALRDLGISLQSAQNNLRKKVNQNARQRTQILQSQQPQIKPFVFPQIFGGQIFGAPSSPSVQPQTTAIPQSNLPPLPPTGTGGPNLASAQQYGASRRGGRKHAGQDFDAGPNDTFYSRIGGEVTFIGYDPSGYFNYVDIYNSDLNVTERVAEGDTILVKRGQTITPGTPIARGTNTTGVFHYEIRKGKATTYGFTGTVDPIAFLNGLQTTQIAKAQPQKPAAKSAPAVAQYAPYEEPKREAALIPIPTQSGQQQQQKASGSGSPVLTYPVDPYQALNSYYNFQVLGFLYKQG